MAKVRFLKEGGNPNDPQEEQKDDNLLTIGDMQLDRGRLTDTFRNFDDFGGWAGKYKGLSGSKIQNAVASRAREIANGVLKGEVSLQDLTTFTSQNKQFESDGKTKKRFLGGYNPKDNNTVNAIAARYVLDVMGRSKYNKKPAQTKEDVADELEDYNWDYVSGMLGSSEADRQAAITGLSQVQDRNKRLGIISKWFSNAYGNIAKAKESGKYKADTDWSQYDQYAQIQDWLKDDATYKANYENILSMGPIGTRLAGTFANLMGDSNTSEVPKEDAELLEERRKAEQYQKQKELEDLKRKNKWNQYYNDTWNQLGVNDNPYDFSGVTEGNSDGFRNLYSKFAYTNDANGNPVLNKEYVNYIEDVIGDIYKGFNDNIISKGLIGDQNAVNSYFKGNYGKKDKYLKDNGANVRANRLAQYTTILNTIRYGNKAIPTTYNPTDHTVLVHNNGKLQRINIKQAVANGFISSEDAKSWIEQGFNRTNGYLRTGGVIKKGQLGMRMNVSDSYYNTQLDEDILARYQKYNQEIASQQQAKQDKINEEKANQEAIQNRVKDQKGSLNTPEAKKAMERKEGAVDSGSDVARLVAAGANLTSAITALTGLSPLSAGLGLAGSTSNLIADINDDSVSRGEVWKNAAINYGLDALTLIPFAGSAAAATKVVRVARSLLPVLGAYTLVNGEFGRTYDLAKKLVNTGWKSMSKQDWTDLMNGVSQISGFARTAGSARSAYKTRANAAAASGKMRLKVHGANGKGYMDISETEWKGIHDAGKGTHRPGKKLELQNAELKRRFGDDIRLAENQPLRTGVMGNARYVHDYDGSTNTAPLRYTWMGNAANNSLGKTGNTETMLRKSASAGDKRKTNYNRSPQEGTEVRTPQTPESKPKNGGVVDKIKDGAKKGVDKVTSAFKGKLPDGKTTINGKEYMRKTTKSTGKQKYYVLEKNKKGNLQYEEIVNPNKKITSAEYKKLGGRLIAHSFANGGVVKYDGGGQVIRNTYSKPNPLDYSGYTGLWGKTVGTSLYNTLAGIKDDEAKDKLINDSRSIQSTYKGAVDVSGVGYNQGAVKRFGEVSEHQTNFNNRFGVGNKAIEDAAGTGLITRRGRSGDNAAQGFNDGYHGVQDSLRTIGAAFSDEDRKAFEESKDYKNIRQLAANKGLMYRPIKNLSTDGKYYYGFEKLPEISPNPVSLASMVKPEIPTQIKPLAVNQTNPVVATVEEKPVEQNTVVETDPANLKEKSTNKTRFNATGLLDLVDPIAGTIINNKAVRKAQEGLRPNLVDAYRTQVPVENDYWAKRNAEEAAARFGRFGSRAANATADAALGNATWLAVTSKGEDAIREGNDASRQMFYKTRGMSMDAENENTARWTQAANANRASMNGIKALKANMEANRITGNYTGIWQPWLREKKANALMAGKLRQAQATQLYNLDQSALFKEGIARESDTTDPNEQYEWMQTEEGRNWYNNFQKSRLQGSPAYNSSTNYVSAKDYFPIFARRGARVRSSYAINLGLDDFTKEFFRTERSAKNASIKERIASTAGIRLYVKDASQNITDYNKMMSYARKRK